MKKIMFLVAMFSMTTFVSGQNTAIYKTQGGDGMVVGSGGTLTVASGGTLELASGSTLTDTATASHASTQTFTGNVYFGAVGYKSTNTASSGAWVLPATLNVIGAVTLDSTLDVDGNEYHGAAAYRSTFTASSGVQSWTGSLTSQSTITGTTVTGTAVVGTVSGIEVSTSATSQYPCRFAGSAVSLPTTGYTECDTIYQVSDHTMYIATETVTAVTSWKAVW